MHRGSSAGQPLRRVKRTRPAPTRSGPTRDPRSTPGIGGGSDEQRHAPKGKGERIPTSHLHGRARADRIADRAPGREQAADDRAHHNLTLHGRAAADRRAARARKYVNALDAQADAASAREASTVERRSAARAARNESDDHGGLFDRVGKAAAGAISEVGKAPIVKGGAAALGIEAKVGKAALDVLNKKLVTIPNQVPGASRTIEGARDITVGDVASVIPAEGVALKGASVASKLTRGERIAEGIEGGATAGARTESATSKVAEAESKTATGAESATKKLRPIQRIKDRPRPVKAAKAKAAESKPGQAASKATQKVKGSKAGQAASKAANTKAGKAARWPGKHPKTTVSASLLLPGTVEAARTKNPDKLTAPIEGTAKAIYENPIETGATTGHAVVGGVGAALGIGANVGKSGVYATREGLEEAGLPGGKHYSGKEIIAPTKAAAKTVEDFAKDYYKTYSSGDPDLIQKKTEEEYGLGMALPLLGAFRHGAVRKGHLIEHPEAGMGRIPAVRKRRIRKRAARGVAGGSRQAAKEGLYLPDELDKITGHKGRRTRTPKTPTGRRREQTIATAAAEGATTRQHLIEQAEARNKGKRHPEAPSNRVTRHDVAEDARRDSKILNDKQVAEGLDLIRREQGSTHLSDIKTHESQFITANHLTKGAIKHPHDVTLPKGTEVPDGKGGVKTLKADTKWIKNPSNPGQHAINDFIAEVELTKLDEWRAATGRAEPVYVGSVDVRDIPGAGETAAPRGKGARPSHVRTHQSEGKLNRAGLEDVGYETFRVRSLFEPRAMKAQNEATAVALEREAMPVPVTRPGKGGTKTQAVERFVTEREKNQLIAQGEWTDPATGKRVKADDVIWIDSQTGKAAVKDRDAGRMVETESVFSEPLADSVARREAQANSGAKFAKGKKFFPVNRVWGEEFLAQHGRLKERWSQKVAGALLPTQRLASKALLGYSPSWLLAQPVAEAAQALAAVGPYQMYKGHKRYKAMSPELQRRFDAGIGQTVGTGSIYERLTNVRQIDRSADGKNVVSRAAKATRQELLNHPAGRLAEGIMTGRFANAIDKTKGGAIRRLVAAGHMEREFNGFTGALNKALHEQTRLDHEMRGLTPQQRIEWAAKNPKQLARLENYVDDVMGNWDALTTNEQALGATVMFYPFVRMSMEWTALTYPARHPFKAAALQFLGMNNAQQVENLFGGEPSYFTGWMNAPLYNEKGEPTSMLPTQRFNPGSNALFEALGSDVKGPRDFVRAINPAISIPAAAIGGYDPRTGRSEIDKFEAPSVGGFVGSVANQIGQMPAPLRIADTLTGRKASNWLTKKEETPSSEVYKELSDKQALRSFVPGVPLSTSKERTKAEFGRLQDRKYAPSDDLETALANLKKANYDKGDAEAAKQEVIKVLDSLVAENQVKKYLLRRNLGDEEYNSLNRQQVSHLIKYGPGSFDESIKAIARTKHISEDQAKDLLYSQLKDLKLGKTWTDVLDQAADAGFGRRQLRTLRRARGRKLMGGNP